MAASMASVGCKASASLALQSSQLEKATRPASVTSAFGLKPAAARVSCSFEENVRAALDAGKAAAIVLASSALVAGVSCMDPWIIL
jgi:photosystem II oxygen-evolving enhancer protein 1